jgi:hypothetical protein
MNQAIMDAFDILRLAGSCTVEEICAEIANLFSVHRTEVGLLRAEGEVLRFLHPAELQVAGVIPLSSTAIAARTATTKKSEIFNNFSNVPHHTVFELVKLTAPDETEDTGHMTIQKFMSVPILAQDGEVLGVLQVSRKGLSPRSAGPDFTQHELLELEKAAQTIVSLCPSFLHPASKQSCGKLQLHSEQKKVKSRVAKAWNLE